MREVAVGQIFAILALLNLFVNVVAQTQAGVYLTISVVCGGVHVSFGARSNEVHQIIRGRSCSRQRRAAVLQTEKRDLKRQRRRRVSYLLRSVPR